MPNRPRDNSDGDLRRIPFSRRARCDDGRAAFMTLVEYFEEEFGAGLGKRHIAEFVDDKQFDDGELGLELAQTPLVARFHQLMNEPGRREEGNGEAMLAGGEAKRQTRIHLARAGITQRRRPSSSIFGEARKSW